MNIQSLSDSMESVNETPRYRFLYNWDLCILDVCVVWPIHVCHVCSLFRVMVSRNLDFRVARKQIKVLEKKLKKKMWRYLTSEMETDLENWILIPWYKPLLQSPLSYILRSANPILRNWLWMQKHKEVSTNKRYGEKLDYFKF